jgi:hypothetical protein
VTRITPLLKASDKTALAIKQYNEIRRKPNLAVNKNQKVKFPLQLKKGLQCKPPVPSHEALGITSLAKTSVRALSEK